MPSIRSWGTHCPVLATVPDMGMVLRSSKTIWITSATVSKT
jgi:hypothetical protein